MSGFAGSQREKDFAPGCVAQWIFLITDIKDSDDETGDLELVILDEIPGVIIEANIVKTSGDVGWGECIRHWGRS